MAKLLFFVALLLVASAVVAEAGKPAPPPAKAATAPAPAPSHSHTKKYPYFYLKTIINNLAYKPVTFKLVIQDKPVAKPVVAKPKQWTAIGPVKVGLKVPVVLLYVTVKNYKGEEVKKSFHVKLAKALKNIYPKSSKYFVVTVSPVKSHLGRKKLVFKVDHKELLVVWL